MSQFKPTLVAVYGTLRKGFYNNSLLDNATFKDSGFLKESATMFSNGGFPILSFKEGLETPSPIRVEVFEVIDQRTMDRLDSLEGYPNWYNRTEREFTLDNGSVVTAWIYHQDQDFTERLPLVASGDWCKQGVRA